MSGDLFARLAADVRPPLVTAERVRDLVLATALLGLPGLRATANIGLLPLPVAGLLLPHVFTAGPSVAGYPSDVLMQLRNATRETVAEPRGHGRTVTLSPMQVAALAARYARADAERQAFNRWVNPVPEAELLKGWRPDARPAARAGRRPIGILRVFLGSDS